MENGTGSIKLNFVVPHSPPSPNLEASLTHGFSKFLNLFLPTCDRFIDP